jgi:arginine/serine-rich splicing factor 7
MSRVYVGNLDPRATERELEDEFRVYGVLRRFAFFLSLPYSFHGRLACC